MRTALFLAIGLAAVVGVVPASFAQDPGVPDHGKSAGSARPGGSRGISLAVPIGRVSVGPEFGNGEPIYVRRTTVREGITIVEVSATPFMPVVRSNEEVAQLVVRADQPASW